MGYCRVDIIRHSSGKPFRLRSRVSTAGRRRGSWRAAGVDHLHAIEFESKLRGCDPPNDVASMPFSHDCQPAGSSANARPSGRGVACIAQAVCRRDANGKSRGVPGTLDAGGQYGPLQGGSPPPVCDGTAAGDDSLSHGVSWLPRTAAVALHPFRQGTGFDIVDRSPRKKQASKFADGRQSRPVGVNVCQYQDLHGKSFDVG